MTPLGLGAAVLAADLEIYKKFPVLDVFWTLHSDLMILMSLDQEPQHRQFQRKKGIKIVKVKQFSVFQQFSGKETNKNKVDFLVHY